MFNSGNGVVTMDLENEDVYYSPSTMSFYYLSIHGASMPPDARKISKEVADGVRIGQLTGEIAHDAQGMPYIRERTVTDADRIRVLNLKVEVYLDEQAAVYNYKSIDQAVSFANDATIAQYQAEGKALQVWRAKVYAYVEAQIAAKVYDFDTIKAGMPEFKL